MSGGGFTQVFSAAEGEFSSGFVGMYASGNSARLTNFRAGALPPF